MDNYAIADQLSTLSKLMDIAGENSFKSKSYASAAFAIEKLPQQLATLSKEQIVALRGVGEGVGAKVTELLQTGELEAITKLVETIPPGVVQMLEIKGLGPKKIHALWKNLNITTVEELEEACKQNRVAAEKGFGEKTQEKIMASIAFNRQTSGAYLYAQVEPFVAAFKARLNAAFANEQLEVTGAFRRQLEIIERLEWVTAIPKQKLKTFLQNEGMNILSESDELLLADQNETLVIAFHLANKETFFSILFSTSCSDPFLAGFTAANESKNTTSYKSEEAIFSAANIPFIPPFLRETPGIIEVAKKGALPTVIKPSDVKGLIHSHSNWSDGASTIEEMSEALIEQGFEYLVISDHSKAAFYAGGLTEQRIKEQHTYIDALNKKLAPFKIFKSIECDILSDGALDYPDEVLASFDLVIASIHSNLQMKEEKAMMRLLSAVENPYITILGHLTGRRLLKRPAYPVDHAAIIDACAENGVVIEINANPQRLDMRWEWVSYALEKGVLLSVNPDAHSIPEFDNIKYGVLAGEKGGLTKESNLSSFSRQELESYLAARRKQKGI